jgi:hypothetical protein
MTQSRRRRRSHEFGDGDDVADERDGNGSGGPFGSNNERPRYPTYAYGERRMARASTLGELSTRYSAAASRRPAAFRASMTPERRETARRQREAYRRMSAGD